MILVERKSVPKSIPAAAEKRPDDLGARLRKKYQDITDEEIPDRLQRLIDALKEAERRDSDET